MKYLKLYNSFINEKLGVPDNLIELSESCYNDFLEIIKAVPSSGVLIKIEQSLEPLDPNAYTSYIGINLKNNKELFNKKLFKFNKKDYKKFDHNEVEKALCFVGCVHALATGETDIHISKYHNEVIEYINQKKFGGDTINNKMSDIIKRAENFLKSFDKEFKVYDDGENYIDTSSSFDIRFSKEYEDVNLGNDKLTFKVNLILKKGSDKIYINGGGFKNKKTNNLLKDNINIKFSINNFDKDKFIEFYEKNRSDITHILSHEIMHAFDDLKKGSLISRNKYTYYPIKALMSKLENIGIMSNLMYVLYYFHDVENVVRPSEIYSAIVSKKISKEEFLHFLKNHESVKGGYSFYDTLHFAKSITYDLLIYHLEKDIDNVKKFLEENEINVSENNDENIEKFLELFYEIFKKSYNDTKSFYNDYLDEKFIKKTNKKLDLKGDYKSFLKKTISNLSIKSKNVFKKLSKLYELTEKNKGITDMIKDYLKINKIRFKYKKQIGDKLGGFIKPIYTYTTKDFNLKLIIEDDYYNITVSSNGKINNYEIPKSYLKEKIIYDKLSEILQTN